MLVIMGNLVWVFVFMSAYGIGGRSFYDWVDVSGLGPKCSGASARECIIRHAWYPANYFGFFNASRIYPLNHQDFRVITEFPMFSFILGDLHPHVMAFPFVLLVVAAALSLYRSPEPLDITFWLERPLALLAVATLIGALAFVNTWDIATMTFVVAAAAFVSNFMRVRAITVDLFVQIISFALPLLILAIVLYLPFYASFTSQANGIGAVVQNDGIKVAATRPFHLFLFWGPLFVVVIPFVVARLLAMRARITRMSAGIAAAPPALVVVGWAVLFAMQKATGRGSENLGSGTGNLFTQIADRGAAWITALFIAVLLTLALLALLLEITSDDDRREREAPIFALGLTSTAMLLILGTEFFFVGDVFHSRMNTVFKLYYQAWMMLALAGGFSLYYLSTHWRLAFPIERPYRLAWAGAAALALAGAALYPIGGAFNRARPYDNQDRLIEARGELRGINYYPADERKAIDWLRSQIDRQDAVIAEAVGNDYTLAARISAATGVPTIIGWQGHEDQWREGKCKPCAGRFSDVDKLYRTTDKAEMSQILQKYHVTYVYVGDLERRTFGEAGMEKFKSLPAPFQQGTVTIYRAKGVAGEVEAAP